jgi:hypothetical protein
MAATPFLIPHMPADDLSAAFSLRHASAGTGMLTKIPNEVRSTAKSKDKPKGKSKDKSKDKS